MNNRSNGVARLVRIAVLSTALSLATSHAAGADSLRPNADAGGSGGGSSVVYYELQYEQARPVIVEVATSADEAAPTFAVNQNLRSIQLIEGKEVANDPVTPAFVVHPNLRSIQLIEGEAAVAEVAQPASVNAYSICLACSSLG